MKNTQILWLWIALSSLSILGCKKNDASGEADPPVVVVPPTTKPVAITPAVFEVSEQLTAENERARLQNNWLATDFSATGIYVTALTTLKIKVELTAGASVPRLLIGTYSRYGAWSSVPSEVALKAGLNEITSPASGLIWIKYTNDNPASKAKLTFTEGFKNAPFYVAGKTTKAAWLEMLNKLTDAPDVVIQGDRNILVVERAAAIKYQDEDLDALLKKLADVLKIEDDYAGLDGLSELDKPNVHSKYLMVEHEDPAYYFFAYNYRTAYIGTSISAILTLNNVTNDGWGVWHELGHQHQQAWTWSAITEATVNIFSRAVQRSFTPSVNRLITDGIWPKAATYLALPDASKDFNGANIDVWQRLCMFEQLRLAFGNNFYPLLHKKVRADKPSLTTDAKKMDYFMKAACQVSGKDLSTFFKKWGLNTSSSIYTEITALGLPQPTQDITLLKD